MMSLRHPPLASLLLAALAFGCASDGSGPPPGDPDPNEPDPPPNVLHDVVVYEQLGRVGVVAPDGSGERLIPIGDDIVVFEPAVSPDGRQIAFVGRLGGQWDIFVVNADGSARRRLTQDAYYNGGPAWLPDGDSLTFGAPSLGHPDGVFVVMAADGSGRRELPEAGTASGARWSPDGTRVAFYGYGERPPGIYTMDSDGAGVARIDLVCDIPAGVDCSDSDPRWSPDGAFIAFRRSVGGGNHSAGIMRADGSESRILHPDMDTGVPAWSPDGERVAVTRWHPLEGYSIYIVTVATGDTLRLPVDAFVSDWAR
jgi:dipeptidyl aminopeptidase/acylaminoacyl peptidase